MNKQAPELLEDIDEINEKNKQSKKKDEITLDIVKKIVQWDKKNKRLEGYQYKFMAELAEGKKPWSEHHKKIATLNLNKAKRYGFKE
ncbi:MAG: hypothetical protein IT242_04605 [Bacteroidia bacterium]|nr:hypothetical protein [Bacteroidia bacterium]